MLRKFVSDKTEKYEHICTKFQEIDSTKLMLAGGKGANLGELPGWRGYGYRTVLHHY